MPTDVTISQIPIPHVEYRATVGPTDEAHWHNPSGNYILSGLPIARSEAELAALHDRVFDFGCGCGRVAIQMLEQRNRPSRYLGIDISRPLLDWCVANLTPIDDRFQFQHHDVFNLTYAPGNSPNRTALFPAEDDAFSLVLAHSVFTHVLDDQARHYLQECARVIDCGGLICSTWFFFNRDAFLTLAPHQNCLYVNEIDSTQAVYFDWQYFRRMAADCGMKIVWVDWTQGRGFHTTVYLHKGDRYPEIAHRLVPPATLPGY